MPRSIQIELERPEDANEVAYVLEYNGYHTDTAGSLAGPCEVSVRKPLLHRGDPFRHRVEAIVRRWIEERAPHLSSATLRTGHERVELAGRSA